MIRIEVRGTPVPQGSHRAVATPAGPRVIEDNKRTKSWRAEVTSAVEATWGSLSSWEPMAPFTKAVVSAVIFRFQLPKKWRKAGDSAHIPKKDAPLFVSGKPDRDKLARAVGDAISAAGCAWTDDCLDTIGASAKVFVPPGAWSGAIILLGDADLEWFEVLKAFRSEVDKHALALLEAKTLQAPPRRPKGKRQIGAWTEPCLSGCHPRGGLSE